MADEADFTSLTPYNYSFNNPILYNDPYGDCPLCIPVGIAILEGVVAVAEGATIAAGVTTIAIGLKAYGKEILDAMGNTSPYSTPAVDFAQSGGGVKSLNSSDKKSEGSAQSKDVSTKKDRQKAETQLEKKQNQLEGIEKAQDGAKKQKQGEKQNKVNSVEKSKQNFKNELKRIKTKDDAKE